MKIENKKQAEDLLASARKEISSLDIWRALKDNNPLDVLIENVPDEFDTWAKNQISALHDMYDITDKMYKAAYIFQVNPIPGMTRKEIAERILKTDKSFHDIFFKIYDNKDYSEIIWKKIRPAYSKPFNTNDDEN